MEMPAILTITEVKAIKSALLIFNSNAKSKEEFCEVELSLDLGISKSKVKIDSDYLYLDYQGDVKISISDLDDVKEDNCYVVQENKLVRLVLFGKDTNFYYKLLPTSSWPTITFSSTPMHRHSKITTQQHVEYMVAEISPLQGKVLDCCCGLGYAAILSSKSKSVEIVDTYEIDKNVQVIASYNPYSKDLYNNPKIKLHMESIIEGLKKTKKETYDRIIHDPPTSKYTPWLYTVDFQTELFRVLKRGGILYQYAPCPDKHKDRLLYPRLVKQLQKIGFKEVEFHELSSGIKAVKK